MRWAPQSQAECSEVTISRFGVIPKSQPGKFRLFFPSGTSVNDGIDQKYCSMKYANIDKAGKPGAFHTSPGIPKCTSSPREDRPLLGMTWKGKVYMDKTLPFGLRSALKIISALADALERVLKGQWQWSDQHHPLPR